MIRPMLAAVVTVLAVSAPAAAAEILDSAYTRFDSKICRHTPGRGEEDYGSWRCKGLNGIAVRLSAGDQRMTVSFGPHAADEPAASETFGAMNDVYEGTIEWRLERRPDGRMRPFATILRWNVRIDEDDGGHVRGRVLVVTRLGPGGVCRVGTVDATDNPTANEAARQMADKYARTFRCGQDKPNQFLGEEEK